MGRLNLTSIKASQTGAGLLPTSDKTSSDVDSQISISPDIHKLIARPTKKAEFREDGSQVRRSKEAQIIIRASPKMRRELKRWAVDEDATVQSLIVAGLQALRRQRGLPELAE